MATDLKIIRGLPRESKPGELVALDLEMFQQDPKKLHRPGGIFACMTVAYTDGTVYVLSDGADLSEALERVSPGLWCIQNSLYDLRQLRRLTKSKLTRPRPIWDTMLVEQDLFGGYYSRFDLANLTRRWLHEHLPKGVREKFGETQTLTQEMIDYSASDAWATVRIAQKQITHVEEEEGGEFSWYHDIDEKMIWVVLDMQGIRINVDAWRAQNEFHRRHVEELESWLGINVMSKDQVISLLRSLGVRKFSRTDKGNEGADHAFLESLRDRAQLDGDAKLAEAVTAILTARMYRKAVSTYGDKWLDINIEADGYVYPSWKITGAETGRMACSDPNLQQIPIRELPLYRTFFLSSPGHRLLIGDVNQQETRWTAWLSGDKVLQQEIIDGLDLHVVTADLFKFKGSKDVRRRKGKNTNFGLTYGMSAEGLASRVGISLSDAESGLREREMHYRGMYSWNERMRRQAQRLLRVRTASGRPVWINPYSHQWSRNAINGPIQGSAADQVKLASAYFFESYGAPVLIIHDEMAGDIEGGKMKQAREAMSYAWQEAGRKLLPEMPVTVDMVSGLNWGVKS